MRTVLTALAILSVYGCSTPSSNAATASWSKVPTYFKCDFESHAVGVALGQSTIVPEVHHYSAITLDPLIYTQIDPQRGTARLGPNATIAPSVSLIVSDDSWTFLDMTNPSNVGMTTIFFGSESERGIHRAVDSRHSVYHGEMKAIQQYGHCEAVFT